eukprot:Gb_21908 [translate_table: standard]
MPETLDKLRIKLEERCLVEWMEYCQYSYTDDELIEILRYTEMIEQLCHKPWTNCSHENTLAEINGQSINTKPGKILLLNVFAKFCPLTLRLVNFSHNRLTGSIPREFFRCSGLQVLDLSHNSFSGPLPSGIQRLKQLRTLDLKYNKLSGEVEDSAYFRRFGVESFEHSGLCGWIQPPCGEDRKKKYGERIPYVKSKPILAEAIVFADGPRQRFQLKVRKIALISGCSVLGFLLVLVLPLVYIIGLYFRRPDRLPGCLRDKFKHRFTVAMLKAATMDFAHENYIGMGSQYEVYRGVLADGREVVIKFVRKEGREQIRTSFVRNFREITKLEHENLVRVLGWCGKKDFLAVVMELMDNGSLENWLRDPNNPPSWPQHLQIALQVAEALSYLHKHWPSVGFDLKSRNILLDQNFDAHIADFQLQTSDGYENCSASKVYSYGALLLELMTNKKPTEDFIGRIRKRFPSKAQSMIDPFIMNTTKDKDKDQILQLMDVALICTVDSSSKRPSMEKLLGMLSKVRKSRWPLHIKPAFKRREQHAESSGAHNKKKPKKGNKDCKLLSKPPAIQGLELGKNVRAVDNFHVGKHGVYNPVYQSQPETENAGCNGRWAYGDGGQFDYHQRGFDGFDGHSESPGRDGQEADYKKRFW